MSLVSVLRSALTPVRPFPAGAPPAAPVPESARADYFERLYRDHADRVYGLCLRLTGDRVRAAELAQDVFVRAWQKLDQLRSVGDPGAWLWRMATNVVFNDKRSERRRLARVTHVDDPSMYERPNLQTPLPLRRLSIDAAIARLPDRARAVYVLHDIEGHSHEEIAAILEVAEGTVRAHLHRARAMMREVLR